MQKKSVCTLSLSSNILLLLLVLLQSVQATPKSIDKDYCVISDQSIVAASRIRGLKIKSKVPCLLQTKDQIREYLLTTIETKIPKERLAAEEFVYKVLGMIPLDFKYQEGLVQLYMDQIGGYYDPEKKHFVMAAWMPAIMQAPVAVHELTHALQDQYFNLSQMTDPKNETSDALLARSALIEGDATAVMMDYSRQLIGQGPLASEKDVSAIMMQNLIGTSLLGNSSGIPNSLKMLLIFPYTSGLRFAHVLLQRGGYLEIDKAFKKLPASTEEILHLDKYLTDKPDFNLPSQEELVPSASLKSHQTVAFKDVFGEFAISVLLANYINDRNVTTKAAAGWGGDLAVVINSDQNKRSLIWQTNWDTLNDAQEFFESYKTLMSKRGTLQVESEGVSLAISGYGNLKLSSNGSSVQLRLN